MNIDRFFGQVYFFLLFCYFVFFFLLGEASENTNASWAYAGVIAMSFAVIGIVFGFLVSIQFFNSKMKFGIKKVLKYLGIFFILIGITIFVVPYLAFSVSSFF